MAKRAVEDIPQVEEHAHTPAHPLERLIFFSDAVFAIAITLLIIEVHPPNLGFRASDHDHLVALANLTPSFVAFFISFFVIAKTFVQRTRGWTAGAVAVSILAPV